MRTPKKEKICKSEVRSSDDLKLLRQGEIPEVKIESLLLHLRRPPSPCTGSSTTAVYTRTRTIEKGSAPRQISSHPSPRI